MNATKVKVHANNRNSCIEVLLIIAMLFILLSHFCSHSNFELQNMPLSFNKMIVQWGCLGGLGVDIFVIISGFFLCMRKFNYKSITRLFCQVWFYSIVLFVVCRFGFGYEYTTKEFLAVFFPTLFQEYWFFTTYIVMLLFSPFINLFIHSIDRRTMEKVLLLMLFLWILIPTFTTRQMSSNEFLQFVFLYVLGAYFQMYKDNFMQKRWVRNLTLICSFSLLFLSTFVLDLIGQFIPIMENRGTLFYARNSLLVVACAISLFAIAMHSVPFHNKYINLISGCTFGVYLIHDNPAVRDVLWKNLLNMPRYSESSFLIFIMLFCVALVFLVCVIIEFIRQKTIARPMQYVLDNLLCKIIQVVKKYFNYFLNPAKEE